MQETQFIMCEYSLFPTNDKLNSRISDLDDKVEDISDKSDVKMKRLAETLKDANNLITYLKKDLSSSNVRIADLTNRLTGSKKESAKNEEMQNKRIEDLNNTVDSFLNFF